MTLPGFEEYPLAMRKADGSVRIAKTQAEEKQLSGFGYERAGQQSPAAFVRAQDHGGESPPHQEWPRFNAATGRIEHDPNAPKSVPAGMYPKYLNGKVLVSEEDEIEALIAADEDGRMPAVDRANEKEALLAKAEERGIRVDARWGMERLRNVVHGSVSPSPRASTS